MNRGILDVAEGQLAGEDVEGQGTKLDVEALLLGLEAPLYQLGGDPAQESRIVENEEQEPQDAEAAHDNQENR